MKTNEYCELLGIDIKTINKDNLEDVVTDAFERKIVELYYQMSDNGLEMDDYEAKLSELKEAKDYLLENGIILDDEVDEKKSGLGKKIAIATGAVVVAGAIAIGSFFAGMGYEKANAALSTQVGIQQSIDETKNTEETIESTQSTEATEETKETENKKVLVQNYGDISDEKLVEERTAKVVKQLTDAGVINMSTGLPFTSEELIKVNQFMAGAYVPSEEAEAYSMVNEYLNFCLMDSQLTIAFANMNGVDWDNLKENDPEYYNALKNTDLPNLVKLQETTPKIMIVDNMLYGDVSIAAYNYLKMFETRYQEMIYSTDQKLCDDIYLDLTYSLTKLRVNGEYTFEWNNETYTVTMNDFSGKDKINAGNILQYYVFMYQTAYSKVDEAKLNEAGNYVFNTLDEPSGDKYTYTYVVGKTLEDSEDLIGYNDKNISLDDSVNYADHKYLETTEYFNAACYGNSLEDIALDDEGLIYLVGNQQGENFSTMNQVNSINAALSNYYAKGLSYYNQTFNKTLIK